MKRIVRGIGTFLFIVVFIVLVLSAMIHFFVFIINQEDWFFGTKLAGGPAGLFLLFKAVAATGTAILMAQYPQFQKTGAVFSTIYFGILFCSSAMTVHALNADGVPAIFPFLPATVFGMAAIHLIIRCILPDELAMGENP